MSSIRFIQIILLLTLQSVIQSIGIIESLNHESQQSNRLIINTDRSLTLDQLNLLIINGKYAKYIEIYNQSQLFKNDSNLVNLIFPNLNTREDADTFNRDAFQLDSLNLTNNCLISQFLEYRTAPSTLINRILIEYFSRLRLVKLSSNHFSQLNRNSFKLFSGSLDYPSNLEILQLDSNQLTTIKYDSFYDLTQLRELDLSNNYLKFIHPLTFLNLFNLNSLNLADNQLKAIYANSNSSLLNLKYLNLVNNDLMCDAGLLWLYNRKQEINYNNFKCILNSTKSIEFNSISNLNITDQPDLVVNTENLNKTSQFSLFNLLSKKWFAWHVFEDIVHTTTSFPYLMSEQHSSLLVEQGKHVFHTWYMSDLVLKCSSDYKSQIVWKTQYGYLSYLEDEKFYKTFYQLDQIIKISRNFSVRIGQKFGGESISEFQVNENNDLVVTNMRQAVSGPFVCIALNENGYKVYEYDMHIRTGVGENFINSLIASLVLCIITLTVGIISCCILEYKAKKLFPQTPPYYTTPMASTPPNFDFNEWMSNAASYLPNINIHDTLEQVSKKLRKGMEKASVTVKSIGLTSTAYIYSVYEHSSQRWSDIKSYVPTLNVPTITLPTMRYTPVSQLANRMRTGVGNMFIPMGKFCGTSDLAHTASINDLQSDMNASNTIGKILILDQLDLKNTPQTIDQQYQGYYKFLSYLKEESKRNKSKNFNLPTIHKDSKQTDQSVAKILFLETPTSISSSESNVQHANYGNLPTTSSAADNKPTTSAAANLGTASKPKLNLIVAFINPNSPNTLKIDNIDEEIDDDDDPTDDE